MKDDTLNTARERRLVKIGISSLERPMTYKQAVRYGNNAMPQDLKRSGFKCIVFVSDQEINGSKFFRINYAK